MYLYIPLRTCIYLYVPVYTFTYLYIPVRTCIYLYVQVYTSTYRYIPVRTLHAGFIFTVFIQCNPEDRSSCEQLSSLVHINESSMLHALRQRYGSGLIHTVAGGHLLVINPRHELNIYSSKVKFTYASAITYLAVCIFTCHNQLSWQSVNNGRWVYVYVNLYFSSI